MEHELTNVAHKLRRIARESADLPGLRTLAKALYKWMYSRPNRNGNDYYGAFDSRAQALAAAPAMPTTYDQPSAGNMYLDRHKRINCSDYPMVYWLSKLLTEDRHRLFDLGGHIGVSYYGFRNYITYPQSLQWHVHDVPAVVDAGRAWASQNDPDGMLNFADTPEAASGHDVLISCGALQYLEYTLPELLASLPNPPDHVLVNRTPMHPKRGYVTLQKIGIAVLPYRVMAKPEFVDAMGALGYEVMDHWMSKERHLEVPFEPECTIDHYSGYYFKRA
jgi:putative methyltransferase (TIGR04325 family)